MHSFDHNPSKQSSWDYSKERAEQLASAPLQQNAAVIDVLPNQPFWSSRPNSPESIYEATNFAPSLPFAPYPSRNIQNRWSTDQQFPGVAPPERMAIAPEHTVYRSGAGFGRGAEVAAPMSDPVFLHGPTAGSSNIQSTPVFSWPPPSTSPRSHPFTSWRSSTRPVSRYANHNASSSTFQRRYTIPSSRLGIISNIGPGHKPMPTGLSSSSSLAGAVQPSPVGAQPVPVTPTTLRSRGERWGQSTFFLCMYRSSKAPCRAQIAGDRRGITNHLRDVHNFTCDGQLAMCPWDRCDAEMQRRNIPRHIVTCHLAVKVHCPVCGLPLCRKDAEKKHRQACPGAKQAAGVVVEAGQDDGSYP